MQPQFKLFITLLFPLTSIHLSYTLFSQLSGSPDSQNSASVSPCYTAAVISLRSHSIFLQRASGFIGIHCHCHQHTRVCYILILFIIDGIDPSVCLTSRPQSCQSASSLWLQFSGVWGTFTGCEVIQYLSFRAAHARLWQPSCHICPQGFVRKWCKVINSELRIENTLLCIMCSIICLQKKKNPVGIQLMIIMIIAHLIKHSRISFLNTVTQMNRGGKTKSRRFELISGLN